MLKLISVKVIINRAVSLYPELVHERSMLTNVIMTCLLTVSHQISGSVANITALAKIAKHTVVAQYVSGNVGCYISREKGKKQEKRNRKRESMSKSQ